MPNYEYECCVCGKITEYTFRVGEASAEVMCWECGMPADRVLSVFTPVFVGSGFHCNDYDSHGPRVGRDG